MLDGKVYQGDNTQRAISNQKLIYDKLKKPISKQQKTAIAVAVFLAIGAIIGLAVGLYFHYEPKSNHLQTNISQANDGTVYSSSKFQYIDNNFNGNDVNQTFTIMFAGLNTTQTRRRMLQTSQGSDNNADTTIHYTHASGLQIKFRGNKVLNISVPIDQIVQYIAAQEDTADYARLLQDPSYEGEDQTIQGSDVFDMYRQEVLSSIQSIYTTADNVNVYMKDVDMFSLNYDSNSGKYIYANISTSPANRRRMLSIKSFFHKVGRFLKKAGGDIVHFIKTDGLKILKYGAIAALAGIDIAQNGPSGISDAVQMFKSGNVLKAAEICAQGVDGSLPDDLSVPINFIAQACFSNPPQMHCTKEGAINAAKSGAISFVESHAITSILDLLM